MSDRLAMVRPGDELTAAEVLDLLRARFTFTFRVSDLAAEFGVSTSFMYAVLQGKKQITEPMLESIGVERVVIYRSTVTRG